MAPLHVNWLLKGLSSNVLFNFSQFKLYLILYTVLHAYFVCSVIYREGVVKLLEKREAGLGKGNTHCNGQFECNFYE